MKKAALSFVLVACHDGREPTAAPPTAAPPSSSAETAAAPAAVGFERVTGRDGLFAGMSTDAARTVLASAGLPVGEHTGNAKPPHWLTTEIRGWKATLYLDDADRIVATILFMSAEVASESEAEALATQAAAAYGPPAASHRVDGKDGTFAETHRLWTNDAVELEITVHEHRSGGTRWFVTEQWARRDRR